MLSLPADLAQQFGDLLDRKGFSGQQKAVCLKWLRFYWDFCGKYHFDPYRMESLPPFLDKLQEKRQSEPQRNQARQTIAWFYRLHRQTATVTPSGEVHQDTVASVNTLSENNAIYAVKPPVQVSQNAATQSRHDGPGDCLSPKGAGSSWVFVFDTLHSEIKMRHYSPKTLKSYRGWTRHFQAFTKSKDYLALTQQDVVDFLSYLAVEKQVSASSQNQAFNALLFLYKHVLKKEFGKIEGVVRAKRRPYIPVVLSRAEIELIFEHLSEPAVLIAKLLYGCGLRLFECLNLRVHCFNFDAGILTVHDGKGKKDRTVPIPQVLVPALRQQLQKVSAVFEADKQAKFAGTFLPEQLDKKYKNAAREFVWQWFFPAQALTLVPATQEYRRYHVHESAVQKAIKQAVDDAKLTKRASAHTFRHSFASHLLQANYDIRTIQELLGHGDVRTTMIYTHTLQSRTLKQARSPLDF